MCSEIILLKNKKIDKALIADECSKNVCSKVAQLILLKHWLLMNIFFIKCPLFSLNFL